MFADFAITMLIIPTFGYGFETNSDCFNARG